jgi:SNF2 family DNA or RNA helicase
MYFSNNYSWSNRAQSEDRPHRIGQVNTVTYFDYVAEDTVDVKIVEALKQKQNIAEYFKDHRSIKDFLQ